MTTPSTGDARAVSNLPDEVVEAVARAIISVTSPQMMPGWKNLTDEQKADEIHNGWDLWTNEARAAIEAYRKAMRE